MLCLLLALVVNFLLYLVLFLTGDIVFLFVFNVLATIVFIFFGSESYSGENQKFNIALLMLFVSIFALTLYMFTRRKKISKELNRKWQKIKADTYKVLSTSTLANDNLKKVNDTAAKISTYIENVTNMPLVEKGDCSLFVSSEEFYAALSTEIKSAKRFVLVSLAVIREGKVWQNFFDLIKEKALQGVEIKLMYDDINNVEAFKDKHAFEKLKNHKIDAIAFNKVSLFTNSIVHSRNKSNIFIVDGTCAFSSTIELSDQFIETKTRAVQKIGCAAKVTGDSVFNITANFFYGWQLFGKQKINIEKYKHNFSTKGKSKNYIQPFSTLPFNNENRNKHIYMNAISSAKSSVSIITPYLLIDNEMKNILKICAKSNVDVKLVLSSEQDQKWKEVLSTANLETLLDNGVKVYIYKNEMVKSKLMLIDKSIAVINGGHYNFRSMNSHFEDGVVVYGNDTLNNKVQNICEKFMINSYLLTAKDIKERSIKEKIYAGFLKMLWVIM